ncbi:MAG: cytochrome P450 [Actinomycetes bacterium]
MLALKVDAAVHRARTQVRDRFDDELSVRLLRDRYLALDRLRHDKNSSSWVTAHLFGRPALVVKGAEGVRTFYDEELITRKRAVPAAVRLVLFGPGTVHRLEGDEHRQRKSLMVELSTGTDINALSELVSLGLAEAIDRWTMRGSVDLFQGLVAVYGRAVVDWVGAPTIGDEAEAVARECAAILEGFGIGGGPYPRAVLGRVYVQRWALHVIRATRKGRWAPPKGSVVDVLASQPVARLSDMSAATELVNIVRPTIAIAYFAVFGAHALGSFADPQMRQTMATGDERMLRAFEHEVRRWYPFAPLLAGRLRRTYSIDDVTLRPGSWMVLDIRGTNRDEDTWKGADEFWPQRFLDRAPTAYDFVPQGGGELLTGHRCPGEPITMGVMQTTLQQLATLDYEIAPESRDIPLTRIPSRPVHGLRLNGVRRVATTRSDAR